MGEAGMPANSGGEPNDLSFGIWPTFSAAFAAAGETEAVLAAASVSAMGSEVLPISEPWNVLSGSTGSPRAVAWESLNARVAPFRAGRRVAFCIAVVDRAQTAQPLAGSLGSEHAKSALRRTIDEVLLNFGELLSDLCLGYEVDRYLAAHSESEGAELFELLENGLEHARQHPARLLETRLGIAVTLSSLARGEPPEVLDFVRLGDEALAIYDPLHADGSLRDLETLDAEIEGALERLADDPLPLVLFEVGYPTSAALGSDERLQEAFFATLFDSVAKNGRAISGLNVFGLRDRDAAVCAAEAAAFGDDPESGMAPRADARCTMGLWADDRDKLAWRTVLGALARYR
jgi:hypothetical protein